MLLRNVLAAFLDNLPNERALDLPFLALLADMGFEDVHFTHGHAEFGKDFIAKKREGGELVQFSFQSKAGDVAQGQWRNDIMPQMLEAVVSGLVHPRFDQNIPHQAVLVLSGRLKGNAGTSLQDFNEKLKIQYRKREVDTWDRERLIEYFMSHGPDSFYNFDDAGLAGYGAFLTNYGRALRGELTTFEIEHHSRWWLRAEGPSPRIFEGALEAELLAATCVRRGRTYEALVCLLAHLRALLALLHDAPDVHAPQLHDFYATSLARVAQLADAHLAQVLERRGTPPDLFGAIDGAAVIATYPVQCARAAESAALLYFIGEPSARARAIAALVELAEEPGLAHPISDRSAVSLVLTSLALIADGQRERALTLVKTTAVWIADRYERGFGLAEFDASPNRELELLLGFPFDGVDAEKRSGSLVATALCDLAAFSGDKESYSDVLNELLAVEIAFEYHQPRDTPGQFVLGGADVIQYPNVEFDEPLSSFSDAKFANHIADEEPVFRLAESLGPQPYAALMLLLRDRYFPLVWPNLVAAARTQTS